MWGSYMIGKKSGSIGRNNVICKDSYRDYLKERKGII